MRRVIRYGLVAWLVSVATARGAPAELFSVTPRDAIAAVFVDVAPREGTATETTEPVPHGATDLLRQLRSSGLLPPAGTAGAVADAATSLSLLRGFSFAAVLMDVRAKPVGETSYQLAELQVAIVVKTNGHNALLTQQIQTLLSTWTTQQTARVERTDDFKTVVFTLVDDRWPTWARVRWARLGDYYVIALGEAAFEITARTIVGEAPSLNTDARYMRRHGLVTQPAAEIEWLFDAKRLRDALNPTMPERVASAFSAVGLDEVDRMLGSIGSDGRAVTAAMLYTSGESHQLVPIATPVAQAGHLATVIPPQAKACAAVTYPVQRFVRRVTDTYLACRRESVQSRLRSRWKGFEDACHVSLYDDILSKLSPNVVIHNYPENPLGIGFFVTIVFEIRESPDRVSGAIDAMLTRCCRLLNASATGEPDRLGGFFAPSLNRDDDGVWYLQAGVYGPSLAVVDQWIVLSFSPYAVRQNVALLSGSSTSSPEITP